MKLSIAICTYNRADDLRITLQSIADVGDELREGDELIVVDNNCSDHTPSVVDGFTDTLPIRYYTEQKQGLANARNAALAAANNELLVFLDDDVNVRKGAISEYRRAATAAPNYAFFGGRISVFWPHGQPSWLRRYDLPMLNGLMGHYEFQDPQTTYPPERHKPFGANFALRKELIELIGKFDPNLGVKGQELGRGEETDYFDRALERGAQGMYLARAHVEHRFDADRMNVRFLYQFGRQKGIAAAREREQSQQWITPAAAQLCKGLWQLGIGRRDRFYQCIINIGLYRGMASANKQSPP